MRFPSGSRSRRPRPGNGAFVVAILVLAPFGCKGDISVPALSPAAVAARAVEQYDANKDGKLDVKEVERCAALQGAFSAIDKNRDRHVDIAELEGRLREFQDAQVGAMPVGCQVFRDGQPLAGATVTLVPETFMASAIKPASGVTENSGGVVLKIDGNDVPGVAPGFYKIQVSLKNASGAETIPERYNSKTTLGAEIHPAMRGGIVIRTTSH